MSIKILKYGKRLGVILAGAVIGTTFGMSNFAYGAEELSRGFARPGINRPAFNRPAFNRAAFNRPAAPRVGQLPALAPRPFIRPVINPVIQKVENPCAFDEDAVLGLVAEGCVIVINNDVD
jgi:hypothetical protein